MKAFLCREYGPPEKLAVEEIESPLLKAGSVLIRVKACGVAFPDTLIIQNLYQFKPELPFSPGSEVSGVVEAVADDVRHLRPGDRVFALMPWGGYAEQALADARRCIKIPDAMDFITGATLIYNHGTAYHALKDRAALQRGETLLVLGAGGGIGLASVEIGKAMGATVIAAASSAEKLAACKEKGADFCILYTEEDLRERLKEITQGKGPDVVMDPVGDRYAEPALRSIAWKGRYLVVGFAGGEIPKIPLNLALLKGCAICGVFWGRFTELEPARSLQNIMDLLQMHAEGRIRPHIHQMYPLEAAGQALRALMDRKISGKAVIVTDAFDPVADAPAIAPVNEVQGGVTPLEHGGVRFERIEALRGWTDKKIGPSPWMEISQEMIGRFADATLDWQWIHLDADRARRESPFGATIAHGLFSLALLPHFTYQLLEIAPAKMVVNYGYDKVRFISPVPAGSRIRASIRITGVENTPNGLKLFMENTVEIEGGAKPVCVAEGIGLAIV